MATEAWVLEKATVGEGDEVPNSLAARILLIQAAVASGDIAAIKAITDAIPDAGALTSISDVTDALPDAGALTSISDETDKIDSTASDGLVGTEDSLAYRTNEIERHFHSYESWFELAGTPDAELHVAVRVGEADGAGPFIIDAGNDDWGSWVQILGSDDTPARAGKVKFDQRRLQIAGAERNNTYFLQVACGTSGDAALAAGMYTEAAVTPLSNQIDSSPVVVTERRVNVGTKCWVRCMCPGFDTATLSFYFGIHEYEG